MLELIGLVAIVLSIVAVIGSKACSNALRKQEQQVDSLGEKISNIEKSLGIVPEKAEVPAPPETIPERVPEAVDTDQEAEIPITEYTEARTETAFEEAEVHETVPTEIGPTSAKAETTEQAVSSAAEETRLIDKTVTTPALRIDKQWLNNLEQAIGKRWITWVGAVVLFLGVGLFMKYAFEHKWLGPTGRVLIGVIGGICVTAAGERFVRKQMRALGQGLIGTGLAILYVSLYATYNFYHLLPQTVVFVLMVVVTASGLILALIHDAIAISFLAVLGGFLTPLMLSTGQDSRDALFSYLLLLDIGVLGIAWFKRWRALDILAFIGTWALFTAWYVKFHDAPTYSLTPTLLWLAAFYVVFLIQPFIYHLHLATPIVGERFVLAVSNAMGMFGWAYTILHEQHKHVLGFITIGMSLSYLVLGSLTRKRIKTDERAVFGFFALFLALLTIAVPIHLDFHGVTIAWAVKAPLLVYLAYRYTYLPVRIGCLIPLALAAGRIFTIHWPLHEKAFTPILNNTFGTAIFVALAGAVYAIVHQSQRKNALPIDRILKIVTAIVSAFLALIIMHIEIWQWLNLSARQDFVRWVTALIWVVGAAGFLAAGLKLRSVHSRMSGFGALMVAAILCIWDYTIGIQPDYLLIFNGRFLAALATILIVFSYAFAYLRDKTICLPDEKRSSIDLYGIGIFLLIVLMSFETWQWFALRERYYIARCILPFLCTAGAAAYLGTGIRLRSAKLRTVGVVVLGVAVATTIVGYAHKAPADYRMCFNWRFAAGLAVAIMFFVYSSVVRFFRQICSPDEQARASVIFHGLGIFLLVVLATAELWLWLTLHNYYYVARCLLPLIWVIGAAGYLASGLKLRNYDLRMAGLAVLGVAAILAAVGYAYDIKGEYFLFFNGRFATVSAVSLMVFIYALALRRLRQICQKGEEYISEALYGMGILLFVLFISVEICTWFSAHNYHYLKRCLLPLVWLAGTAGYLTAGIKLNTARLRAIGLVLLSIAGVLAIYGYTFTLARGYILFLNGRFLAALAVVLMVFTYGFILRFIRELCTQRELTIAKTLYGIAIALLFILLNVEMYLYFSKTIIDPERAQWATQMSLSILWAVYATALLAIGFWRKVRPIRLSALGLFGATALKVVILDMANVEEVYRIVSFLVLGALMIGASYLYHRVEKQLSLSDAEAK